MFRLRYTSVSGFPRTWLTARMPCPAIRSPLVTPDVQISRIRRSQIPLPGACARNWWFLLGPSAQLLPQKREFRRPLPRVRNRSVLQAVLPSSYTSTYLAGPLRSTDITPLRRYYAPRRLPTRAAETVMLSRPALDHMVHPDGSPRFLLRSFDARRPQSPRRGRQVHMPVASLADGRLHPIWKAGHSQVCVSRPKRVHFITAYVFVPTRLRTPDCSDARSLGYMQNRQFT